MACEMHDESLQRRFRRVGRRLRRTESYLCRFPQVPCVRGVQLEERVSSEEMDSVCSGLFADFSALCLCFSVDIQSLIWPSSDGRLRV